MQLRRNANTSDAWREKKKVAFLQQPPHSLGVISHASRVNFPTVAILHKGRAPGWGVAFTYFDGRCPTLLWPKARRTHTLLFTCLWQDIPPHVHPRAMQCCCGRLEGPTRTTRVRGPLQGSRREFPFQGCTLDQGRLYPLKSVVAWQYMDSNPLPPAYEASALPPSLHCG